MKNEHRQLVLDIENSFSRRILPKGRIIDLSIDLDKNLEAQRVSSFCRNSLFNDENSSSHVAFHYLTCDAAISMLPKYMSNIIENYNEENFINDVIIDVLCSGMPMSHKDYYNNLGVKLKSLMNEKEISCVCQFISVMIEREHSNNLYSISQELMAANYLWCQNHNVKILYYVEK